MELIQSLDGRSPYTEFLDLHGEGVHHLACVVEAPTSASNRCERRERQIVSPSRQPSQGRHASCTWTVWPMGRPSS
ncbi:hypothetical protein ABT384_21270 [Streptomyces lanatus]|uniref:Uncharacterized protein n=1 Tax=Streptomyces lanatus TaxID=66900 RepID=A0ABV1XU97_9ACTN